MCVPKTARWIEPLRRTLARVYGPTTRTPVPWLLSADVALTLQGVDTETDPDSIEFRAISPVAAAYFALFMRPFEAPLTRATILYRPENSAPPSECWRSNPHQRVVSWSDGERTCWLGRWSVDGTIVQVLYEMHEQGTRSDPLSLAARTCTFKRVHFEDMQVPVVPLEFLLADSALRAETRRTSRILHALRAYGHNNAHLKLALSTLPTGRASRLMRLLEFSLVAG